MRVAMVGLYPADPDHILGGVEAVTYLLSRYLATLPDVEVHVLTLRAGLNAPEERTRDGVHVVALPQPRFGRLTWHRRGVRRLHAVLNRLQPDIVHAHGSDVFAAAAVTARYPHVVTVHGVMAREAPTVWGWRRRMAREVDRWFERWVLSRTREVIAISPYLQEAYPWLNARIHPIENPVDPRYFDVPEGAMQPGVVLCVARVIPRKGILPLIRAFARVAAVHPHAVLEIAGETTSFPEYAAACQDEVRRQNLAARVRFLGPLNPTALAEAYGRAQVVVLASLQETAPVVIAEAFAAGRPVVATAVGGVPYMVRPGDTGWLVPPHDEVALAEALTQALADPARSQAMGRTARAEARRRFHPRPLAEQHRRVYQDIVQAWR